MKLPSWSNASLNLLAFNEVIKNRHSRLTCACSLLHPYISWPRVWTRPEQRALVGPCSSYDERREPRLSLRPTHTDGFQAWLKLLFPSRAAKMLHASLPAVIPPQDNAARETRWNTKNASKWVTEMRPKQNQRITLNTTQTFSEAPQTQPRNHWIELL